MTLTARSSSRTLGSRRRRSSSGALLAVLLATAALAAAPLPRAAAGVLPSWATAALGKSGGGADKAPAGSSGSGSSGNTVSAAAVNAAAANAAPARARAWGFRAGGGPATAVAEAVKAHPGVFEAARDRLKLKDPGSEGSLSRTNGLFSIDVHDICPMVT